MAISGNTEALDICVEFLRAYIEAQNVEMVARCLSDDVEMIDNSTEGWKASGRQHVTAAIAASAPMMSRGCILGECSLEQSDITPDVSAVTGVVEMMLRGENMKFIMYVNALCCRRDGRFKIRIMNIHADVAGGDDITGSAEEMLDGMPEAVYLLRLTDKTIVPLHMNKRAQNMIPSVEGSGIHAISQGYIQEGRNGEWRKKLERLYRTGVPIESDEYVKTGEGWQWVRITARIFRRTSSYALAIVEADMIDKNLRLSLMRAQFDAIPGGVLVFELHGDMIRRCYVNEELSMINFRHSDGELIAIDELLKQTHEDDRETLGGQFAALKDGAHEAGCDFRLTVAGGAYRWFNVRAREFDDGRDERTFYCLCNDIDDNVQAREALERASVRQDAMIRDLPSGIAILRMRNQIMEPLYFSDVCSSIFGMTRQEYMEAITPETPNGPLDREDFRKIVETMDGARDGGIYMLKCNATHNDGSHIRLSMEIKKQTENGEVILYMTLRDTTAEVRRAREENMLNERYKLLMERTNVRTFDYDPDTDILSYNGEVIKNQLIRDCLTFIARGDMLEQSFRQKALDAVLEACQKPGSHTFECMVRLNGWNDYRWVRLQYVSLADEDGHVYRIIGRIDDIQHDKEREERLRAVATRESLYRRALTSNAEMALGFDLDTGARIVSDMDILPVNVSADCTLDGLFRQLREYSVHPDDRKNFTAAMYKYDGLDGTLDGNTQDVLECRMASLSHGYKGYNWMQLDFSYIKDEGSGHRHVFVSAFNINERKRRELYYERQANVDQLTGLLNGTAMQDMSNLLVAGVSRTEGRHAFAMIDVDKFRNVNDTRGHTYGDNMLKELAETLRAVIHEDDVACRFGWDVFGILMDIGSSSDDILRERMRIICTALSRTLDNDKRLTVSIGVAISPRDGNNMSALYACAERAVEAAKDKGGDCFMIYSSDMADAKVEAVARKPVVSEAEHDAKRVFIRTFGHFDVFADGRAVMFNNTKAKEMLAVMVDRDGGFVSANEMVSALWPDDEINTVTLSRSRKTAMRLRNILKEYDMEDVVETLNGRRRIVPEKVDCDYFNFISGDPAYAHLFTGLYMSEYDWAANTLSALQNRSADEARD